MSGEPILVVEDNASSQAFARFTLEQVGYEVRTASDAHDALEVLASFQPRLILMDVQLPGVDGLELTRRLKADPRYRDVRIVALTAYAMQGDERRVREAGCDDYLTKPILPADLRRAVAEHLGHAEPP